MPSVVAVLVLCVLVVVIGSHLFVGNAESINPETISFFDKLLLWMNHWGT